MMLIKGSEKIKSPLKYPVVTMGNFDGVHKGHQKILHKAAGIARKHGGSSVLYTFNPHPVRILAPELAPPLLQNMEQKIRMLDSLGLDALIIEPFDKKLSRLSAERFFDKIIAGRIGTKEIVVGYDFTFGMHRSGKTRDLLRLAKPRGITVHVVDAIFLGESLLSSTHIRHYIEKGELSPANAMLGRPYSIEGRVIKGRGIGATLGFHTANLKAENELIPPPGVYITGTRIEPSAANLMSVTNIGYNPTIGGTALSIETHILDFDDNLLKKRIEISFHKKIRREMTFETLDDLRKQIEKDIIKTRNFYEKRG